MRLLLPLLRLLLPAHGRHRATPDRLPPPPPEPPRRRSPYVEPLVMDTPLVRPYLHHLEIYA
ncbi:hypothetical protein [Streptomyces sp. NPDC055509]